MTSGGLLNWMHITIPEILEPDTSEWGCILWMGHKTSDPSWGDYCSYHNAWKALQGAGHINNNLLVSTQICTQLYCEKTLLQLELNNKVWLKLIHAYFQRKWTIRSDGNWFINIFISLLKISLGISCSERILRGWIISTHSRSCGICRSSIKTLYHTWYHILYWWLNHLPGPYFGGYEKSTGSFQFCNCGNSCIITK